MCKPIKLSFGMVNVVGQGTDVLDGYFLLQGEGGFAEFSPFFNGTLLRSNVLDSCQKVVIFPYGQYIVGTTTTTTTTTVYALWILTGQLGKANTRTNIYPFTTTVVENKYPSAELSKSTSSLFNQFYHNLV